MIKIETREINLNNSNFIHFIWDYSCSLDNSWSSRTCSWT